MADTISISTDCLRTLATSLRALQQDLSSVWPALPGARKTAAMSASAASAGCPMARGFPARISATPRTRWRGRPAVWA